MTTTTRTGAPRAFTGYRTFAAVSLLSSGPPLVDQSIQSTTSRFHGPDRAGSPIWPVLVGAWLPGGSYSGTTSEWAIQTLSAFEDGRVSGMKAEINCGSTGRTMSRDVVDRSACATKG